jgi:hypothetical protein
LDQIIIGFGIAIFSVLGVFLGASYFSDKKKKEEITSIELKECVDEKSVSKMSDSQLDADIRKRTSGTNK